MQEANIICSSMLEMLHPEEKEHCRWKKKRSNNSGKGERLNDGII